MEIKISRIIVKLALWFSQFVGEKYFVVCKGYGDDWEDYTGLGVGQVHYHHLFKILM